MNAVQPANRKTSRYELPGGRARPVMYAENTLTTMQKRNQSARLEPMLARPFGSTVMNITGPFVSFSTNAGDRRSFGPAGDGIM